MGDDWMETSLAYTIRHRIPKPKGYRSSIGSKWLWCVAIWYNCYGGGIPIGSYNVGSDRLAKESGETSWAYPKFTCIKEYGWLEDDGKMIDQRSLWMYQNGCCPPGLLIAQLGEMEMPS